MQNNFSKTSIIFSIVFFIFSFFVFLYFYKGVNTSNQKLQLKELEWQAEKFKRDEVRTLDHSIKIIEGERKQLETHFAQSSDIVPFLDTIEGLAPQTGIKAEIISVDILKNNTGLMVGMKAAGTFNGLYKFLTLLENSPYELEFVSMNIQKETESSEGSAKWNGLLKIKLLSFVE